MIRFFERGGAWVLGQSVLLVAVALLAVRFHGSEFHSIPVIAGAFLMIIGAATALAGALALGKNLTPFPKPAERAQLVRHGVYRFIRHPLYASIISVAVGWALVWQSWPALLVAAALVPFFHAKASQEERWLRKKFPEYAAYERQARRFIPWIY